MRRVATVLAAGGLLATVALGFALPTAAGGRPDGRHMGAGMMPRNRRS